MPRRSPDGGRAAMDAVASERQTPLAERPPADGAVIEQLIFTMHAGTSEIVKVEKIEAGGARRAMSVRDTAGFIDRSELNDLDKVLNEAFEAGLSGMLDAAGDETQGFEAEEGEDIEDQEEALRRAILVLIGGVRSRRRLHRRILERLLLCRALRHQGRDINKPSAPARVLIALGTAGRPCE